PRGVDSQHHVGRGAVRRPVPVLNEARARRLRAPLLLALAALLALEAVGGIVIFVGRLAFDRVPGEGLHVVAGLALTVVYAIYQWAHWDRVAPVRAGLDYGLGILAALSMALVNATGLALALPWWRARVAGAGAAAVDYPPAWSAIHNI